MASGADMAIEIIGCLLPACIESYYIWVRYAIQRDEVAVARSMSEIESLDSRFDSFVISSVQPGRTPRIRMVSVELGDLKITGKM